jgi:predicted dehydrogenase
MSNPFRIAFIGVDHSHGAGWRELLPHFGNEVEITALVPAFEGGVTSLEERYASVPRFNTVHELIARGEFDGAMVCLSNADTPAIVTALANAGKHVLMEKPGGGTEADFAPAAKAITESGIAFTSGYLWRYDAGAERIKAMIAEGRFGKLVSLEACLYTSDVNRRGPSHYLFEKSASGRGFFNWLGCHLLDLIPWLTNQAIVGVTARVGRFGAYDINTEDGGTIILDLDGGTLVTVMGGYFLPRWAGENRWAFRGSQRWVHWDPVRPGTGGVLEVHGPQPQFHAMEETFTLPPDTAKGYGGTRGVRLVRDWIDAARGGENTSRITVASCLALLRLLDLVYRSSEEGRRIECRIEPCT